MPHDYRNRLDLLTPTLALSVWAAHFLLLWSVSSILPEQPLARWLALALTVAAFAALYGIKRWRRIAALRSVPGLALALSTVAVAFTALPALIG